MTVYFALGIKSGRIKIGCSRHHIERRVREHGRIRQEQVFVLVTTPGDRRVEAWWHRRHAEAGDRYYGKNGVGTGRLTEWFRPTPQLWDDIGELLLQEYPA